MISIFQNLARFEREEVMATENDGGKVDDKDETVLVEEDKGKTFRKRRLSLTKLRQLDNESGTNDDAGDEDIDNDDRFEKYTSSQIELVKNEDQDDKAHTFRKRRLSLTSNKNETALPLALSDEDYALPSHSKRLRTASDATAHSVAEERIIHSKTLHAAEILTPPSPSSSTSLPKFYQQAAPPQQLPLPDYTDFKTPKWKQRHTRPYAEDDPSLPFPRDIVGIYSCHGVEPIYDGDEDGDSGIEGLTMAAKINQDRGGVAFPYGNSRRTALFAVYDGHGQGGELVSQYSLNEVQRLLEKHPDFNKNIEKAFKETFIKVNSSLEEESLIEPVYAGTTACVALLRDKELVLSNAGDSRAVLARKIDGAGNDVYDVIDLTEDQNPDLPAEQERIERMGGFVSPPPEPGLSSRVWLDKEWTQIGLAMARSIGDYAVKSAGVIAEPVVSSHTLHENDCFFILATDGVWEFISSAEAVEIVAKNLHKGATKACQKLIETAAAKWHDEEGDYRDDITALVVRLQHLLEPDRKK